MKRSGLCVVLLLLSSFAADAAWAPWFEPAYIQLRPGETKVVQASGSWPSGISLVPFTPWTFTSDDPAIATVTGTLSRAWPPEPVTITGLQPGVTYARVVNGSAPADGRYAFIVVAERELQVVVGMNGVFAPGSPVTLTAYTDEPDVTITWYGGRRIGDATGDYGGWSTKAGEGPQFTFVPSYAVEYRYWVFVQSAHAAGATSISVQIHPAPARTRAVRH